MMDMKKKNKRKSILSILLLLEIAIVICIVCMGVFHFSKSEIVINSDLPTALTAASLDHSAWIKDGRLVLAGEPYEDQDRAEEWKGLVQVAISDDHVVALDAAGTAHAAGTDSSQQCGIDGLQNLTYIAAGMQCSVGILQDGTAQIFGVMDESLRQALEQEKEIQMVSIGDRHVAVLHTDGTVSACGNNDSGQCEVGSWKNVRQIGVGYDYTAGLTTSGEILFAGNDACDPSTAEKWTKIQAIAAGHQYLAALDEEGNTYAAGDNLQGECNVNAWKNVESIAAGYDHTIGISETGELYAVGYNGKGQCEVGE